jgi:hypothetical protein
VAVQVHWMDVVTGVSHRQSITLALMQMEHGRHLLMEKAVPLMASNRCSAT